MLITSNCRGSTRFSASAFILVWVVALSGGRTWLFAGDPPLIPRHATWKYFASSAAPPADWNRASFDDSDWRLAATGIGYGDDDDRTVLADMPNRYRSVYLRTSFELDRVDEIDSLYLYLRFDDGFVAYLNGKPVASHSVVGDGNRRRVALHEALRFEEFVIQDAARFLVPGKNLIAIEGHNQSLESSDFSLDPVIATHRFDTVEEAMRREDFLLDLAELRRRLEDQSSYLTRRNFDYQTAWNELRAAIDDDLPFAKYVAEIRKLVMQTGDCHARVEASGWPVSEHFLPLRPADTSQGVAALSVSGNQSIDSQSPYIDSIDGVALERWLAEAARYVPKGSPQLVRRRSLEWLAHLNLIRDELGLPRRETVAIGLQSADGSRRVEQKLRLSRQRFGVANVPLRPTRRLDDNIGYIRVPAMTARVAEATVGEIQRFRDTDGLIIDVRDNGGGTQEVLLAVYGFFVPEDARPYVSNIAAYRLSDRFKKNHIEYRPTYRANWTGWDEQEREAIRDAAARFTPEWLPPREKFSQWHYLVLSRRRSGRSMNEFFFYDKPVVVLCNAGSFSATDGFLSAFADLPQVTIVGEPSSGGSGSKRNFRLPNTQIQVTLSSMASFRAGGKLFDGNGVEVDLEAKPTLEDFTSDADSVLQRAVGVIRGKQP